MKFKRLYNLLFIFLFSVDSKGDCFIAKENNVILKQEGDCSHFYPFMETSADEQIRLLKLSNEPLSALSQNSWEYTNNLSVEDFTDGWKLYGRTSENFPSNNKIYQTGCSSGWVDKGKREIFFVGFIEDDEKFNSLATKRAKERAKEYLRPLVSEEFSYNELLDKVPKIFVTSIKEVISKSFLQKNVKNIKFKKVFGGLSQSRIFQINSNNDKYILRLLDEKKELESRKSEISVHRIASKLKIAPRLIYSDQLSLVSIMEFIEGRTMYPKDLKDIKILEKIIANLKKFHNYPGNNNLPKKTKLDTIKNLYQSFIERNLVYPTGYTESYEKLIQDFKKFKRPLLPSHRDLNPGNILITKDDSVYFIDWSEVRIDNPLLDIGWLSSCSGANLNETKILLKKYLGKEPSISELKEVLYFKSVTNFFVATVLIGEQEEKDSNKMDLILRSSIKKVPSIKERVLPFKKLGA